MSTVSFGYFLAGIGCGWVPPILNRYKGSATDFSLTTEDCSLIASLHYAGKGIACLLTVLLIDKVGRNPIFIFGAISSFGVWLAVFLTKSIPLHFAIRLLFGLSAGSFEMACPVYIGENSSPKLRCIFGGICVIFFYSGELVAFFVGTYFAYGTIAIVFMAITIASILSTFWLREPAQYLLMQGREEKAAKNFFTLRGSNEAAKREFDDIKVNLQQQKRHPFSIQLLAKKGIRAVCIVNLFMYLTGFPPINAMSSLVLLPIGQVTPNELTIILGLIQLISVTLSSTFIERFGRRPLLMTSAAICFFIHVINGIVYYFNERGTPLPFAPWLLFIFITGYSVVTASLIFPISTVIRGELLSPQLKPIGSSMSVGLNSILSVGMTTAFLMVAETYGMHTNFFFFAIMSALMFVYVYVDLLETKGLTLTEIQKELQN